jgi:hypothetical protein
MEIMQRIQSKALPLDPGKASDFIAHLPDAVTAGVPVVLYVRVSSRTQGKKRNLFSQLRTSRRQLETLGLKVVAMFRDIASGWQWEDRPGLRNAIQLAKKGGAIVVAESTDRFIRSEAFHTKNNPGAQPTQDEFRRLQRIADGVPLATILHPDTPWAEVRGHQSRRGQHGKQRRGGRPRKEIRRSKADPKLRRIITQHGGEITVRGLMRASRAYSKSAEYAKAALIAIGMYPRIVQTGGRPKEVFRNHADDTTPRTHSKMHSRNARRIRLFEPIGRPDRLPSNTVSTPPGTNTRHGLEK